MREVQARSGNDLARIRARAADTQRLGTIVVRILESQAQRAFLDQRLGEHVWPERYPGTDDPFVNLAALVHWTNTGGEILSRFFDRRPALMGTGDLANSISGRVSNGFVEVGSALPYAGLHQWGGVSSQPVTSAAKDRIAKFIGEEPDGRGGWRRRKRLGPRQKAQRERYFFRLFPLLGMTELSTQVHERPFLGITPQNEREIADSIEEFVAGDEG